MLPLGVAGLVAPYVSRGVGLPVPVAPSVEVVDHVLPGLVVLAAAGAVLAIRRFSLVATLVATLAGFWISATHLPLLLQANRGEESWPAALIHSTGGILILVAAAVGAVLAWEEEPGSEPTD